MTNFGVFMFATDYSIQPIDLARAAEERGFESLFIPEHTHIPASRKSPWPGGGELPQEYWHLHDPFIGLAAAAAVTKKIKLATGICLIIEHDPIVLAKTLASLDMISGGRVILGIGAGWNAEEMENHGTPFKRRWKVVRERVLAMREIWTKENAEFHGEFVNFDPIWSLPKPVQKAGPPIILGSGSKHALKRIVEYCDGWLPIHGSDDLSGGVKQLREAASQAGRKFETISLSVFGVGPREEDVKKLKEIGFQRIIFALPPAGADKVLPMLDNYAKIAAKNA
jgi:probable F420-dependent oxidoreductase